jgi:hypothetical protein
MDPVLKARLLALYDTPSRKYMPLHLQQFCFFVRAEELTRLRLQDPTVEPDGGVGARKQLVEALSIQGKYEEALEFYDELHQFEHLRKLIDARERPDTEMCDCDTPLARVDHIWSTKHNDFVFHFYCPGCGDRNITGEPIDAGRANPSSIS